MTAARGIGLAARNVAVVLVGIYAVLWLADQNVRWLESSWRYVTVRGLEHNDWSILASLDPTDPYGNVGFHWSVPAAWVWAYLVVPMGFLAWSALHFAALATIRNWRVVVVVLLTFPFWSDLVSGNMLTFAFVAAWHALDGRRAGVVAFCILAALIPRPLMLPVLAWLLWHRVDARWTFAVAAAGVLAAAVATGTLGQWTSLLLAASDAEYGQVWNIGPSQLFGAAWVPLGLALAALATWRGHLGLASILASPYLIHYYAIFALLELRNLDDALDHQRVVLRPRPRDRRADAVDRPVVADWATDAR